MEDILRTLRVSMCATHHTQEADRGQMPQQRRRDEVWGSANLFYFLLLLFPKKARDDYRTFFLESSVRLWSTAPEPAFLEATLGLWSARPTVRY